MSHHACIDQCNSLLRGEISAVEAYAKVIDKFGLDGPAAPLQDIQSTHAQSVADLQRNVISMGGEPAKDAGAWGLLTGSIQTISDFFGQHSAVASLIQGEEHGKADYLRALDNPDVMPECGRMIHDTLLARIERNLAALRAMKAD